MKRVLAAMAVIGLLAAGCGDDEEPAATTTTTTTTTTEATTDGAQRLAVESPADNEKSFRAPDEVPGGIVTMTFRTTGG